MSVKTVKLRQLRALRAANTTGKRMANRSDPAKRKKPTPVPKGPAKPVIVASVAEVLEGFFHLPLDQYTPGSVFSSDLGADELDIIEVVMTLEEKFDVSLESLENDDLDVDALTVQHVLDALKAAGAKL